MKAAKLFLAVIFIMAISFGAKAQDKYEYATVIYKVALTKKYGLTISKEGKFEKVEGEVSEEKANINLSPAMEQINKMSKEGWEVYNSSVGFQTFSPATGAETYYSYLLRKKI